MGTVRKFSIISVFASILFLGNFSSEAAILDIYTNPLDFQSAVVTNHYWDFNDLPYDPRKYVENVNGPGNVVLLKAIVGNGGIGGPMEGQYIFLNPESPSGMFQFNSSAVTSFGLSATWADFYNPLGIEASFYDIEDNLIGSIALNSENAIAARYLSPEAPYRSLHYDGFIGLYSSVPISRMVMSQQYAGSVYYDGLYWYDGNPDPEPSPFVVKPPKAPFSPTVPQAPTKPKSPKSPVSPTSPSGVTLSYLEQDLPAVVNPEPATILLFAGGLLGIFLRRRK